MRARRDVGAAQQDTTKADALGNAHIMCTGWSARPGVLQVGKLLPNGALLTHRCNLTAKFLDLEKRGSPLVKSFGIRLGKTGRGAFDHASKDGLAKL